MLTRPEPPPEIPLETVILVTPEDTAAIALCTKAVVAILVVLSTPDGTVGAVGNPVKLGEFIGTENVHAPTLLTP